jgi:general stress protein 26
MFETHDEILALQALIERSFDRAGSHLLSIVTPERRLTARQTIIYLQGIRHIAVATVSPRGEPRVSPVDGHFLRGRFYFGTTESSQRVRHLRRNPAISVSHFVEDKVGVTVHGHATILNKGEAEADWVDSYWTEVYGSSAFGLAPDVVFVRVEPDTMITYAPEPDQFQSIKP